jgi:hypothetical protein
MEIDNGGVRIADGPFGGYEVSGSHNDTKNVYCYCYNNNTYRVALYIVDQTLRGERGGHGQQLIP